MAISLYLAQPWIHSLAQATGHYSIAFSIVLFIALIPGYLNMLLLSTLFFYKYQPVKMEDSQYPPITLMITAYNEENSILETLRGLKQQDYPNTIEVIVINDASTDKTVKIIKELNFPNLKILTVPHGGKANALNMGLEEASCDIIVTIDADTFLHKHAIKYIVTRILSNEQYVAVAGHILVKNERRSRLARLQVWDYMLGISAVKRQQGHFEGTLVAQGAFSVFRKKILLELHGWEDCIGEDIVLTWAFLEQGYKVGYEPMAIAFTNVPLDYGHFARQRRRWARGMIEGFKKHINLIWKLKGYSAFFVALDLFFPFIDFFYTFVFLPGVIMACFGYYYVVGLTTLFVIPISIFITIKMFKSEEKFLGEAGIKIRENRIGIILYVLLFQLFLSPVCVLGYVQELFQFKRKW
jgi:biofilm PGA synthesis N-glycosyltransferase PgaC